MSAEQRVAVAMSGGVDSSVTAALLLERGYGVRGITARFWREQETDADIVSAQAVCAHLGIEHEIIDLRDAFYHRVVQVFVREYAAGRTPNPCIACNRELKFGLLLDHIRAVGDDYLATGHYARLANDAAGWRLLKGVDAGKDQSYFLYMLGQAQLAHLLLPLGDWHKAQVTAWAAAHGLPLAGRSESQDVCFLRDGDYRRFMQERAPEALLPGPIVDLEGNALGRHNGLGFYTIGQRGGLGIAVGEPLYVVELDAAHNRLIVGPADRLGRRRLEAEELTFVAGSPPPADLPLQAKIRYRARPVACRLTPQTAGQGTIEFAESLRDITPGQAVVMYNEDTVIGGGIIRRSLPDVGEAGTSIC